MNIKVAFLSVGILTLFSQGCAVSMNLPMARFDVPEAQGRLGKGYAGVGLGGSNELTIVPDTTASSLKDSRSMNSSGNLSILGDVGLLDRLDAEVRAQAGFTGNTVPFLWKLKYQLLGEPRESATLGNFSMAVTFGGGASALSQHDTDSFSDVNAVTDAHFWDIDFGLIAGYRFQDWLLLYGGPFYTRYGFSGTVTQSGTGRLSAPLSFSGNANQSGLNAGFAFGSGLVSGRIEAVYAYADAGSAYNSSLSAGGLLVFEW